MDGLVEELLRLESAKHTALVLIDASAYDANVREQVRLLAVSKPSGGPATSVERLLALSQLITLNNHLLHNLRLTTPLFAYKDRYSAEGRVSKTSKSRRETASLLKNSA